MLICCRLSTAECADCAVLRSGGLLELLVLSCQGSNVRLHGSWQINISKTLLQLADTCMCLVWHHTSGTTIAASASAATRACRVRIICAVGKQNLDLVRRKAVPA